MIFSGQTSLLDISGIVAFGAGVLSFFSPCVLPLVPSYLIFISGITFDNYIESGSEKYRKIVLIHSLAFILGFSLIFVSLGFSSSLLGSLLSRYQDYIIRVGGVFLIIMGLYYLNIIRLPFLNQHKVIHIKEKPVGLFGSFIVGITFSLGWTPCVGPVLSSILIMATASENVLDGAYLLSLYSLGMAVPFLFSSMIFDRLLNLMKRFGSVMRYSQKILGILLIVVGFLLVSSLFTKISFYLGQVIPMVGP
ncbi:MAG TPA: cytochrome c biogenesis protein CcdA [Syntrophorhabdaceae bacterium]|nr:cytochrome c biogenesis protein CcdA [Syntrophorhabdaceae bacterium]HOL06467.1 cytochrome c biogenesis protein CcdA [Syntrophorhabdaceae bacterium]HON85875.1 cytochrome c biogenesis protein CcdA [Syntrophorhabdaceae bacterium]HOT41790.1 cytochrome c biogenesis protein CcdA [Syntrophorhabdaceae bacterium]HPC67280.1 cytochrome c biogenesis protein CcdA [Syntrophorhabdaceae bacterium]